MGRGSRSWWSMVVLTGSFGAALLVAALRCMGVFFISLQSSFDITTAQTGAIFSTMSATSSFGCTLGGAMVNHLGCRRVAILGGFVYFIATVGATVPTTLHTMIVLATLMGLGSGLVYTAALVIVAQYFKKHYTLATSFMTIGESLGWLVFPLLMQQMLDSFGWRGALLVFGAIASNACVAGAVYRPIRTLGDNVAPDAETNTQPTERKPSLSPCTKWNPLVLAARLLRLNLLLQSYRLAALCFSKAAFLMSYDCFLIYIVPRATRSTISDQRAAFLISINGICSIVGRALCGPLNLKFSAVHMYQTSMFICGCAILVAQGSSYAHFVACAAILGCAVGCQHTIEKVMLRDFVGLHNMASALGIILLVGGAADFIAPILSGAFYDATQSYLLLFYIFSGIFFLGFLVILTVPLLKRIEPGVTTKEGKPEWKDTEPKDTKLDSEDNV